VRELFIKFQKNLSGVTDNVTSATDSWI